MHTHLGYAIADRFAVTKIPKSRADYARQDTGLCLLIAKTRKLGVKFGRAKKREHP